MPSNAAEGGTNAINPQSAHASDTVIPIILHSPVVLAFWIMSLRFGAELDPLITAVLKRLLVLAAVGIFLPTPLPNPHNFE